MRRFFIKNKTLFLTLSLVVLFFVVPHSAKAAIFELNWTDAISGGIGLVLEVLVLPLASAMLALSGMLLDSAIGFSLNTAYIFSLSPAINLGWVIIRDICNIFFIFILIYISIQTIVQGGKFQTKALLTQVIIAAMIINFSLFITKSIVDVSNVFGLWLYGGITKTLVANSASTAKTASLSDLISTRLGIIQWASGLSNSTSNTSQQSDASQLGNPSQSFIARILRLVIVLIATYIFFYCSILFITRSVTLLFIMVFSPIGFMGEVLPQIREYSSKWWSELITAATFPVAFLLMLYIALQFINSLKFLNLEQLNDQSAPLFLIGNVSVSSYFQYFLIIMLLQACLSVAKDNSGKLGSTVKGFADGIGKFAINAGVGVASGGASLLMRTGAAAVFTEKNDQGIKERGKAAMTTLRAGIPLVNQIGRGKDFIGDLKKAAKEGSYDVRNAKIPGVGKETLGGVVGNLSGVTLNTKTAKEYKEEKGQFDKEIKLETSMDKVLKDIRTIELERANLMTATTTGASPTQIAQIQARINNTEDSVRKTIAKTSNEDLEKMSDKLHSETPNTAQGNAELSNFTDRLKPQQADTLNESKNVSADAKRRISDRRLSQFRSAFLIQPQGSTGRKAGISASLGQLSGKEVLKIGIRQLSDVDTIEALKVNHLKQIMEEYTYSDRTAIRDYILNNPGNTQTAKLRTWLQTPDGQNF